MTVKELIEHLQTFPQELTVIYRCYSEQELLDPSDIYVFQGCVARPDGWVQHPRPDMEKVSYVLFPGN